MEKLGYKNWKYLLAGGFLSGLLLWVGGCQGLIEESTMTLKPESDITVEREVIVRPLLEVLKAEEGKDLVPRPVMETARELHWIDMNSFSLTDLVMVTTLQGNINRTQPELYIIHDEIVEGPGDFQGSAFWFAQLDEQYQEKDAFKKMEHKDPYSLVTEYFNQYKGAVLYHERLADDKMASRDNYTGRYSDIALLNLTLMMCGQYEAIALTEMQYQRLTEQYGVELKILGDTRGFMERENDGSYSENRSNRGVWWQVYSYAIAEFGSSFSKAALHHNTGLQAANFDYLVAHRLFVYNRIFSVDATVEEREMEEKILAMTSDNTPVFGCWYLQADEGNFVPLLTSRGKFFVVTYESFNLSWTSGLPRESISLLENPVSLDLKKKYIAFTFTEGDNNSYLQFQMPRLFQSSARGEYPIGWTIAPTCWDLNPNIIKYFGQNWAVGDSLTMPEAGAGYVYSTPPEATRKAFFHYSDASFRITNTGTMRVLQPGLVDCLPYASGMTQLDGIFAGYLETGNNYIHSDQAHFLFRDVPVMLNYDGRSASVLAKAEGPAPGFYMISMYGWGQSPADVKTLMESLPEDFIAVTPNQLVDLYRQHYGKEFQSVKQAHFVPGMSRSEMGFLYEASDYTDFDAQAKTRSASGENYFVYKFDVDPDSSKVHFFLTVSGDYQIELSQDYIHWTVMERGSASEKQRLFIDASALPKIGGPFYLRLGDSTLDGGKGVVLHKLEMGTSLMADRNYFVSAKEDELYWLKGGERIREGRTGDFVYHFPLPEDVEAGDLVLSGKGEIKAWVSSDNLLFEPLSLIKIGRDLYCSLHGLKNQVFIRLKTDDVVEQLAFRALPTEVTELGFSPVSNQMTKQFLISPEQGKITETDVSANREIQGEEILLFRFPMDSAVEWAELQLALFGSAKVEIAGTDLIFQEILRTGNDGRNEKQYIDVTPWAKNGQIIYLQISSADLKQVKGIKLSRLRLVTNLASSTLLQLIEAEKKPDIVLLAGSEREIALLDHDLSVDSFLYAKEARGILPEAGAALVYALPLKSGLLEAWAGQTPTPMQKLKLSLFLGNGYRVSLSTNQKDWQIVAEEAILPNEENRQDVLVDLTPYLAAEILFVRVDSSPIYTSDQIGDLLVWNLKFYLN